jgi:hypothetical protein
MIKTAVSHRRARQTSLSPTFAEVASAPTARGNGLYAKRAGGAAVKCENFPNLSEHRGGAVSPAWPEKTRTPRLSGRGVAGLSRRHFNGLPFRQLTESGSISAGRRVGIVLRVLTLLHGGCSLNECAVVMQESVGTLHRFLCLYSKGGLLGLIPGASTGRRTVAERLSLTTDEIARIAALVTSAGSVQRACQVFAGKRGVRRDVAEYLSTHHRISAKLRAAIVAARKASK